MPIIGPMDEWECRNAGGIPVNCRKAPNPNVKTAGGPMICDCSMPEPKQQSVPTSITVSPTIQTQVSPQISPVFQQQFQPTNSPATAGTTQAGTTQAAPAPAPAPAPTYSAPAPAPTYSAPAPSMLPPAPAPQPTVTPSMPPGETLTAQGGTLVPVAEGTPAAAVTPAASFDWRMPAALLAGLLGIMLLGDGKKRK